MWRQHRLLCFSYLDESRKCKLLHWVQGLLPRVGVEDFTASWHDGLALCSLLEEVCPGLCPRPELLKAHHRVNNCRLGIKLAQRFLGVPKMMITAEEMAIADADIEMKIIHLVQLIKWRHQRGDVTIPTSCSQKARTSLSMDPLPVKVVARGTGLKAGIVGRRAKFNILTDSASFLDLHIAIQGPNNEMNSERITSINQGVGRREPRGPRPAIGYQGSSEDEGKSKYIEDDVGNIFLRQKSVDEDLHQNVIPFDYQCVGEGRFLVTYIPRSSGTYFISIKSHEVDIEGSPFEVKVSDWMSSWNVMPKPRVMSFDMLPSIEETPNTEKITPNRSKDEKRHSGRNRMAQVSKQLTIMKKRVLKRVITRNGEEILLTPSPTLSRQSSADVSDLSEDDQSSRNEVKKKKSLEKSPGRRSPNLERAKTSVGPCTFNDDNREDFSNNSCNITLSVTSFEDEEEQEMERRKKARDKDLCAEQAFPLRERPKSPTFKESPMTTFDMTPGMYPSSPKRLAKIPESPIHISVRSQLLGPSSYHESGLYTITNDRSKKNCTEKKSSAAQHGTHLSVFPICQSPTSSDDASGNNSDVTDFGNSPRHGDFPHEPPDRNPTSNNTVAIKHPSHENYTYSPMGEQEFDSSSANRRRFEESLNQEDQDADDSVDACSQLVSALTEFNPSSMPSKKTVGRSYSDGAKLNGIGRERLCNIRVKSTDDQDVALRMSSSSTNKDVSGQRQPASSWNKLRTKILQSNSLNKTCIYIKERAVSHSLSASSSNSEGGAALESSMQQVSPLTSSSSGSLSTEGEESTSAVAAGDRRNRMLDVKKKWKTFDGGTTVEHEGEWGTHARWRFSLQGKRCHSFTAPGWYNQHFYNSRGTYGDPRLPYTYDESTEFENMSIIDKLNDDDEILEVVIESDGLEAASPEPDSAHKHNADFFEEEEKEIGKEEKNEMKEEESEIDSNTESSLTSSSMKNMFRGNLSRQDNVGSSKSSSEFSAETDRSRSTSGETGTDLTDETETRRFKTIQKQSKKSKDTSSVSILVPKAKTDKSTQVTYDEIKAETGWKPPAVRLHRRKKYLKVSNSTCPEQSRNCGSGNPDRLAASPKKQSSTSSKSSSVSDSSLTFASDASEHSRSVSKTVKSNSESRVQPLEGMLGELADTEEGSYHQETVAKNKGREMFKGMKESKDIPGSEYQCGGLGTDGESKTASQEKFTSSGVKAANQRTPSSSFNPRNTTSDYSGSESTDSSRRISSRNQHQPNSAAFRESRVHPYGRARSDPQFSRSRYLPDDPNEDLTVRRGGNRGRPPRPRDDHVMDWIQRAAERDDHEQPERQSTVDTLDSGIENESPIYSSFVSGHRRIHRRPYPWSIDLDPSLVRANAACGLVQGDPFTGHRRLTRRPHPWEMDMGTNEVSQDQERLQLTLGVIEAAVHHTVRRLLSGSSAASSGSHRKFPNFSHSEEGGNGGSYSDSELYSRREELLMSRKKTRRKSGRGSGGRRLTKSSSGVKEDFFRSVAILSDEPAASSFVHRGSPDIGETKSDGRYSPYSLTDIPCFELPSDTTKIKQNLLGSPSNTHRFPHRKASSSRQQQLKHMMEQKSQDSTSNDEAKSQTHDQPSLTSSQTSLALRRQVGVRSSSSSPEMTSLTVNASWPRHKKLPSRKSGIPHSHSTEKETESDTNTSEDSLGLRLDTQALPSVSTDISPTPSQCAEGADASNPRIVIHPSSQHGAVAATSSTSTEDSYCGFGISRTDRHDLIDHLKEFRDLTERQKLQSPDGSRGQLNLSPSSMDDLYLTDGSASYLSQYSDPFDENSPLSSASFFAQQPFFDENDLQAFEGSAPAENPPRPRGAEPESGHVSGRSSFMSDSSFCRDRLESSSSMGKDMSVSPLQAKVAYAFVNGAGPNGVPDNDSEERRGRCMAYGAGLSFGQVGLQNNFQVWTERPGNGCVTVAVFGPRSHCVTETNVTYIGDNVYDVNFSVTSPGYYVIVVKWGDQSVPDSPFICKVTY